MENRVSVVMAGRNYTLLSNEDDAYVNRVAAFVDAKVSETAENARISLLDAALLTCANIADEYFKAQEGTENLRRQLKSYLEESARSKNEILELKRQLAQYKK